MGKRARVKHGSGQTMYLVRDNKNRFKKWTNIGKSINYDKRQQAKIVKPGYGHIGDLSKSTETVKPQSDRKKTPSWGKMPELVIIKHIGKR